MLPFTTLDNTSNLFLIELMLICPTTTLFTLFIRIFFKITFNCFKSFRGFYWFQIKITLWTANVISQFPYCSNVIYCNGRTRQLLLLLETV